MNLSGNQQRIFSIDLLRGLVMIIMALDHTRDLFHVAAWDFDPADPEKTWPSLFFTRWITHFCAPVFVFLSGASAWLTIAGKRGKANGSVLLLTRGLWLILLEFTVVTFGFWFDYTFSSILLQVIFAIGAGMVFMSLLIHLPRYFCGILGLILIAGQHLIPALPENPHPWLKLADGIFLRGGYFPLSENAGIYIGYPVLPWLGIMLLGYYTGKWFTQPMVKKRLLITGIICILLFLILRSTNLYGDGAPWADQHNEIYSLLSFLNVTKYPPSFLFTLMTLGPALVFLGLMHRADNALTRTISVYGKVPMFYYLIHWYLLHSMAYALAFIQGYTYSDFVFGHFRMGLPEDFGVGLPGVYLAWGMAVVLLWPACNAFRKLKQKYRDKWWVSYV